ncbi:SoxR reducing system RseC family protein [Treponema sp.]|uniref:SoxR reducing system RseC family protein n=1 Tax=Treponema sp. TaxID=166 RepID=UPI003F11D11E
MTEKALVVSVENEKILVSRLEKDKCSTCSAGCAKNGRAFEVLNPNGIKVEAGSIVIIGANKKIMALQGIVSLLIPFLCAFLGYFLASPIAEAFNRTVSEDGRAVFVLLFLFLSSAAVFIFTRKIPIPGKPEIVEVL